MRYFVDSATAAGPASHAVLGVVRELQQEEAHRTTKFHQAGQARRKTWLGVALERREDYQVETGANELARQSLDGWKMLAANPNVVYQGFPDIRRG